jgi:hypothetical protein
VPKYITKLWDSEAQHYLETNLQNNPSSPFATDEEYKHIQCWIKREGMKMYYDNLLMEENTILRFPSIKNGDAIQNLVASMADV